MSESAALSTLRGTALSVLACLEDEKPRDPRERTRMLADVATELRRALAKTRNAENFDEIASRVLTAPGVEDGVVQLTAALDKSNVVRVPGGAGAWIQGQNYRDTYRVFVRTEKKHYEATAGVLLDAVREAFAAVGLSLPKGLQ